MYILQLMDNYVSSWSVFLMAGLESVTIGWIYGELNFKKKSILKMKKKKEFCTYDEEDTSILYIWS